MLGFLQEHGPFVNEDTTTTFHQNEFSWNLETNVLYIESPGGVGYSTCSTVEDCKSDDHISAQDNLEALWYFYTHKFPELQQNDLWISGESYAGLYVPYLALYIDNFNEGQSTGDFIFNLKGFMVGNGCTNWEVDCGHAYVEMAYWHGLYDIELYEYIHEHDCIKEYGRFDLDILTPPCIAAYTQFMKATAQINVYDVNGKCYGMDSDSGCFEPEFNAEGKPTLRTEAA